MRRDLLPSGKVEVRPSENEMPPTDLLGSLEDTPSDRDLCDTDTFGTTTRGLDSYIVDAAEDVIAIIRAGARGYVTKNIQGPELVEAIYRIASGDAVFSRRLAGFVLDAFTATDGESGTAALGVDPQLDQLTTREREVLRHIVRGYAYKEIANQLEISIKTVESHVSAVLRKLQLSNRHQLSNWATERRLL